MAKVKPGLRLAGSCRRDGAAASAMPDGAAVGAAAARYPQAPVRRGVGAGCLGARPRRLSATANSTGTAAPVGLARERLDPGAEAVLDPLQHEAVGRDQLSRPGRSAQASGRIQVANCCGVSSRSKASEAGGPRPGECGAECKDRGVPGAVSRRARKTAGPRPAHVKLAEVPDCTAIVARPELSTGRGAMAEPARGLRRAGRCK